MSIFLEVTIVFETACGMQTPAVRTHRLFSDFLSTQWLLDRAVEFQALKQQQQQQQKHVWFQ